MPQLWSRGKINHVLFECPLALQIWAPSQVPSAPGVFPMTSIFSYISITCYGTYQTHFQNFSGLFGIFGKLGMIRFLRIWTDPRGILHTADTEAKLWLSAQTDSQEGELVSQIPSLEFSVVEGPRCYIVDLGKQKIVFSAWDGFILRMLKKGVLWDQ